MMATRHSRTQPGFFDGPDWPSDGSSEFEPESLPGSPDPSSSDESVSSSDLNLSEPVTSQSASNTPIRRADESQEIALTDEHISMLERRAAKFRGANPKDREKIVIAAADHIEKNWRGDVEFHRDTIISLIRESLYGSVKRRSKTSMFELRKWTYLDVVIAMHRKAINQLAVKLSQHEPGSPQYLSAYRRACGKVERKLSERQRQRYRVMAKEWTEKKLPPKMQQRMMRKHGPRAIKEFTLAAFRQFGMRVIVLAAFMDSGDPSILFFDYNDASGGSSFKARHKDWRQYQMMEDFSKWGAESFNASLTDGSESGSMRKQKCPEIKLKRNNDGYPILPSPEEVDHHDLLCKKKLIGRFIGDIYEMSTGAGKGRVPWTELQRARGDYIKEEYFPKHVTLKQYYHFRQKDVRTILGHWTRRQAAGKVPFRFKKAAKAIRPNTRTSEGNDGDANIGPSGEDPDQQDNDGSQAPGDGVSQGDGGSNSSTEQAHPNQNLRNAAEILDRPSRCSPDNGPAQPSAPANLYAQQRVGRRVVPGSPHASTPPPRTHTLPHRPNRPLANGTRASQTDEGRVEDRRNGSGSAVQEPSLDSETHAVDERQQPQPGPPSATGGDSGPPPASPRPRHGGRQSLPASRGASPEMQGSGRLRRRGDGDAAGSHSSKRQRADRQADGASSNMRRSNRDRRPTEKAAKGSAAPVATRTRPRE